MRKFGLPGLIVVRRILTVTEAEIREAAREDRLTLDDFRDMAASLDAAAVDVDPRRKAELVSVVEFSSPEGRRIWKHWHVVKRIRNQSFF